MKRLKMEFKGKTVRCNEENGEQGECMSLQNMRECSGALEVVGEWNTLGKMPEGCRLMLVDRRKDEDCYLACSKSSVYMCGRRKNNLFSEENSLICTFDGDVKWLQSIGNFVVAGTTQGHRYLCYNNGQYTVLDVAQAVPQLFFSAVNMSGMNETVGGVSFESEYSEWSVLKAKDCKNIQDAVTSAYKSLEVRAKQTGTFIQPVSVRYALRLWDDKYAWISAPVIVGEGIQLSSPLSVEVDSSISECTDTVMTVNTYNVGVAVVQPMYREWLPLIKSVDILVGEEIAPFVEGNAECRCETSGTTRYVTCRLREKERLVMTSEVVNPAEWHVLSSITDLVSLCEKQQINSVNAVPVVTGMPDVFNGTATALSRSDLYKRTLGRTEVANLTGNINRDIAADSGLGLNGRLYSGGHKRIMRHVWKSVQYWGGNVLGQSCRVLITARLRTGQGEAIKVDEETYDYTPQCLNALVSYPDARAKELSVKILCGDTITEWNGILAGCDESGMAYFINNDMKDNELSTGYSFYELTEQNIEEPAYSEFIVSTPGNPFVVEQCRNAGQGELYCFAAVSRSIYSSTFGRYPVYVFTSTGIYAVSYMEHGDYKDVQLIDRRRLGNQKTIAVTGDKVFFETYTGELCYVSGKDVSELGEYGSAEQMVWVEKYKELLLLKKDGGVSVIMSSGRAYDRGVSLQYLYGDFYGAYALDMDGNILDLNEENDSVMYSSFETFPVEMNDEGIAAPMLLAVNLSGTFPSGGTIELSGSDGVLCERRVLSGINVNGACCGIQKERIYVHPCRLLYLNFSGVAHSGSRFRNAVVIYC